VSLSLQLGLPDVNQVLRDDRKHLDVNSVELVEASPGARLHETSEDTSHDSVLDLLTAIEHDTEYTKSLRQIFCRFSLSSSSRSRWLRSQMNMLGSSDREPAPVSQRGDDQPRSGSHVFIAVSLYCVDLPHGDQRLLFFLVVLELFLPFEVVGRLYLLSKELFNDISVVNFGCDQCHENLTVNLTQIATSDKSDKSLENILAHAVVIVHGKQFDLELVQGVLGGLSP